MPCPYTFCSENGIILNKYNFSTIDWICSKMGENFYIGLKKGLDFVREREVLAHEIGHILTDTADNIHVSKYDEQLADISGREFLINADDLVSLIEENEWVVDASILASHFWVSIETTQKRICEIFDLPKNF